MVESTSERSLNPYLNIDSTPSPLVGAASSYRPDTISLAENVIPYRPDTISPAEAALSYRVDTNTRPQPHFFHVFGRGMVV